MRKHFGSYKQLRSSSAQVIVTADKGFLCGHFRPKCQGSTSLPCLQGRLPREAKARPGSPALGSPRLDLARLAKARPGIAMQALLGPLDPPSDAFSIDAQIIDSIHEQTGCKVALRARKQWGPGRKIIVSGPPQGARASLPALLGSWEAEGCPSSSSSSSNSTSSS